MEIQYRLELQLVRKKSNSLYSNYNYVIIDFHTNQTIVENFTKNTFFLRNTQLKYRYKLKSIVNNLLYINFV